MKWVTRESTGTGTEQNSLSRGSGDPHLSQMDSAHIRRTILFDIVWADDCLDGYGGRLKREGLLWHRPGQIHLFSKVCMLGPEIYSALAS